MEALSYEPPRIAGRYEAINIIASGGMALVYRGWDHAIGRYVAIKALHIPENPLADPFAKARFRREAQAAAQIAHPNVVTIYDFIEERGNQFLIMEFVDGEDLKHAIGAGGPLPPPRALNIAEQVCAALTAAHARGMVHRDIKPQNILLTPDGRVRLTDFGIVRVADSDALTHSGIVLGTADYLSPEQARGDPLGPTSDIYSLGIVLYEMLTGVPPFTGANPVSIAMQHATDAVPPVRAANPAIPVAVEALVRLAVAKEPRKRYRSAVLMGRALANCRLELTRPTPLTAAAGEAKQAGHARVFTKPLAFWSRLTRRLSD